MGVTFDGPVPQRHGQDPAVPRPGESDAIGQWRARMAAAESHAIYQERASTSERVTRRTLDRMLVRGLLKVSCVALLNALAYNLLRWSSLTTPGPRRAAARPPFSSPP